jgi:hypothetical protein
MHVRHVAGYLKDNMTKVKEAYMQAFPFIEPQEDDNIKAYHSGMTMRDEFAKIAMLGMFRYWDENPDLEFAHIADCSYDMADAMLKARK